MKCQSLFSGRNKKNIVSFFIAELVQRLEKVIVCEKIIKYFFFLY